MLENKILQLCNLGCLNLMKVSLCLTGFSGSLAFLLCCQILSSRSVSVDWRHHTVSALFKHVKAEMYNFYATTITRHKCKKKDCLQISLQILLLSGTVQQAKWMNAIGWFSVAMQAGLDVLIVTLFKEMEPVLTAVICILKRSFPPKMTVLSPSTSFKPVWIILSAVKHKRRYFEEYW